jgi:hypothetical protein
MADDLTQIGLSGSVVFVGEWPQNVERTHIVLFKEELLDSTYFSLSNLKYISESIPNNTPEFNFDSSVDFVLNNLIAGSYNYLAVVQSAALELSLQRKDWFVVGIYSLDNKIPSQINLTSGITLKNIRITCDFNNPPPQPPGGI